MANTQQLTWDEYFHGIAEAVSKKSKDPKCQVGAIVVDQDNLVISTGFNGFPREIEDDTEVLNDPSEKLDWVVHAEHNAILNAARLGVRVAQSTLYVNKFPCFRCLQVIIQAGVGRVYTKDASYWNNDPQDRQHEGKRYLIQQASLKIDAPHHPSYRPKTPRLGDGPSVTKTVAPSQPPERLENAPEAAPGSRSRNHQ